MYSQVGPNAVVSDQGYRVSRASRFAVRYEDSRGVVEMEVEPGDPLLVVGDSVTGWCLSGGKKEEMSMSDRSTILERVVEAMGFLGTNVEVV